MVGRLRFYQVNSPDERIVSLVNNMLASDSMKSKLKMK